VTFYGPDSRKRQGQLYLRFAAVGKSQTLTAKFSASPMDTRPGSLLATGQFSLVLEAETFDRYLSACGIQYTERGAIDYVCNYTCNFFRLFSNTTCAISV